MINRTIRWLGLAMGLAVLSIAPAQAETTLEVLHAWPGDHGNYQPLADAFMKAHPDVRVEFRVSPPDYNEANLVVTRNAMTGNLPDVYFSGFSVLRPLVTTLKARGQAVPLTPFIGAESKEWLEQNYSPAILSLGQVDGVQYGIPFNASTPIVYYNADLVTKAGADPDHFPSDWEGVIALARKINALGGDVRGMNYSVGSLESDWLWQAAILERGGAILTKDEKAVGYDNILGLETLRFLRHIAEATDMDVATAQNSYKELFFAGKLGFYITSPSSVRSFMQTIGDRFAMRTAPYPLIDRVSGRLPSGGNAAVILAKDPEKQKLAWEFVKFVTGPGAQAQIAEATGYMPTNKKASDLLGPFYSSNPNYATAATQTGIAGSWYAYPGSTGVEIWRAQRDVIDLVQRGKLSPEDGLKRIATKTADLLK
ncbi:ABC transporter substrate-binding protein [Phyllobacterium zundukense]|uniref:ABC transporter substrate-binding protein n=1 Tax=Phyllobacterium zundukense TaxID=1867719 RepID=A0ACD4CVE5_9HYPH|nr:ABC transporter substrate-binding protein [Phyllobacterium zundukense]UXN57544.1 ABC transporter substrate-binding protein [Phyllobacterium zundukense]